MDAPLDSPSPCLLARWGLSLNSKPLCSPSRLGWLLAVKGAAPWLGPSLPIAGPRLTLSPSSGPPIPVPHGPCTASWVRRIKSGMDVCAPSSPRARDSPSAPTHPLLTTCFRERARGPPPSAASLNSAGPRYNPLSRAASTLRTQSPLPLHPRLCPTPTPALRGRRKALYQIRSAAARKSRIIPVPARAPVLAARRTPCTAQRTGPLEPPSPIAPSPSPARHLPIPPRPATNQMYVLTHYSSHAHTLQTALRIYTFRRLPWWHPWIPWPFSSSTQSSTCQPAASRLVPAEEAATEHILSPGNTHRSPHQRKTENVPAC